jgi:hypothetical protein
MNFPFFSNKKNKEYYLGIFLKETQGIVMIFLKENNHLELVDREKFNYTNSWENLTNDVDEALYKLEKNLDLEIKKTIMFVYSHLVDPKLGDIKPVYLQKIKHLIKALDLQPMGYIECFEAMSFYLQKEVQSSLTAILIEIDKTQVGLFTYKGGKLESKNILGRTDDIISDLVEGFEEVKKKTLLPARIILYDSGNLDDTATKILSHRWSSDFFVQIPKVDILSEDEVVNGLMNIFSEQINSEIQGKNEESPSRENFGFLINDDIGEKTPTPPEDKKTLDTSKKKNIFNELTQKIMAIAPMKNKTKFKIDFSGRMFTVAGVLIIALGLFVNEYFFHKVQLTVYLPTQTLEKKLLLDIDYRLASTSADFSESSNTTGKLDVGEKARGSLTIHNFDDKEKIFPKGTVLKTSKFEFILDTEVKVASSSLTTDGSAKLPGKSTGTVIAAQIGPESNLSKSQRFTFDGLAAATYFAVNDSALSGGSKKQIQTVSKKDQENLKTLILNKAKNKVPTIEILPEEVVASTISETEFIKTLFSKEVGEESSKLTLQATVSTTQYLYNKKLFTDKIILSLKPEIKSDYSLARENVLYVVNKITKDDRSLTVDAKINAKATIKISTDEIKKSLIGKHQSEVKEILKSQYKIEGYNITINEPIPIFKNFLPLFLKNIELKNSSL